METKLVECGKIDVLKVGGSVRSFSKEFAVKLSDSLRVDGQQNPIVLRKNENDPERYILVSGRHRLYAMKSVMKEQFIRATVFDDMDAEEAANAMDVENLWRNPLSVPQQAAALQRWHDSYKKKLPPLPGDAEANSQNDNSEAGEAGEAAKQEKGLEKDFDERVASATGKSLSSVRRTKALAKAFAPEELEAFERAGASQADMLVVSKIKDPEKRSAAVKLVASGMNSEEAAKTVVGEDAPVKQSRKSAVSEAAKAKEAAATEVGDGVNDEDWFENSCGDKAELISNKEKYKADAILYRKISEARHSLRSKTKKTLADTKKAGVTGPFYNLVNRFASLAHPKDWLVCLACKGTGHGPDLHRDGRVEKTNCSRCFGSGYMLKVDEYV